MNQQQLSLNTYKDVHALDVDFVKQVASKVRKLRISNNLQINDLSKISGLASDIISGLEEGLLDIYLDDLLSIAEALGIPAIDLVEVPQPDNRQRQ